MIKVWGKTNPTASWNPNAEPDVAGYRLYIGNQSGVYTSNVNVGNTTSYVVTGLSPIQRWYCFAVTAYDTSNNESQFSDEFRWYVSDPTTEITRGKLIGRRG